MYSKIKYLIYIFLFNKLILGDEQITTAKNQENSLIYKLCSDEKAPTVLDDNSDVPNLNTNKDLCYCQMQDSEPWGLTYLTIECNNKQWNDTIFKIRRLPDGAEFLDLSWNNFKYIPYLKGDRLKELIVSNNKLISIEDKNFADVKNLLKLDLSRNSIERISLKAFQNIENLQKLDLSRNRLKILHPSVFSHIPNLKTLILSENKLNDTFGQEEMGLFSTLGLTPQLDTLEMNYCGLELMNIRQGHGLKKLLIRFNNFTIIPDLPRVIEFLDLSGNPLSILSAKFLPHLYRLHTMYLEDMPLLTHIDNYSLYGFPKLAHLNFQGSKGLTTFSEYAFGQQVVQNETDTVLETLSLRGTNIKTLNESLKFAFENIKELDLSGAPIFCDCDLIWISELELETNAKCARPVTMSGKLLSSIPTYQLTCNKNPSWVHIAMNTILILCLIILCGVAIYLIFLTMKPSRRTRLQKLGLSSPYARITTEVVIDPNRAENHF